LARFSEGKKATIMLALLGVGLAGIAAICYIRWEQISGIVKKIEGEKALTQKANERAKGIPKLVDQISEAKGAIEYMTKILPYKGDLQQNAFLKLLQEKAELSRVRVKSLTCEADKETPEKKFARFRYKVVIEGNYPQFVDFLYRIESDQRFLKVDSFEIANKQIGANQWPEPEKEIKLTISTYTYTASPE
jgi:Tfp pilus assembly protein PilO